MENYLCHLYIRCVFDSILRVKKPLSITQTKEKEIYKELGFPGGPDGKASASDAGDPGYP